MQHIQYINLKLFYGLFFITMSDFAGISDNMVNYSQTIPLTLHTTTFHLLCTPPLIIIFEFITRAHFLFSFFTISSGYSFKENE